jgi:hypothetical protein
MLTALTPDILTSHGFVEIEDKDLLDRPIYRLSGIVSKYGLYCFDIQITLSPQYPDSNPNCGIVSIHVPETAVNIIPEDLWDKEIWSDEDQKRADESIEVLEEYTQPIAWHVTTYERLRDIVKSLTLTDLEYGQ